MEPSPVTIEVLPGGMRCLIRGAEVNRADVAAHLRNVLELEPGHAVRVRADLSVTYEPIRALFDSLKAAGFTIGIGYL